MDTSISQVLLNLLSLFVFSLAISIGITRTIIDLATALKKPKPSWFEVMINLALLGFAFLIIAGVFLKLI